MIAAAFLLVPAMPASAHIQLLDIIAASGSETSNDNWVWDSVHGDIICTEGESFLVTAKVVDDGFTGKGREKGTCTGDVQGWVVLLTDRSGIGGGCYERAAAKAHTKIDGVGHDEAVATEPSNCPPPP